jgi:hypothetical protein
MPRNYSSGAKETINATGAAETLLLLLEITHPDLGSPVRVVNDNQDLTSNGNLFVGIAFDATLPDEPTEGMPRASLAIDNVGKDLVAWLETSAGGQGAQVRMMQVRRSVPNTIEWEVTMELSNVSMDMLRVRGVLAFEDILNRPAVALTYRADVAPGLF